MAAFRKKGKSWEASICCKGIRTSKSFDTKLEAQHWATHTEKEILAGKKGDIPNKAFGDLLLRYSEEVSPKKRGSRWEVTRLNALQRDEIAKVMLPQLAPSHFAAWRDRRLLNVSAGSVLREISIFSHAINISIKEWGWMKLNPISSIRKPPAPQPRDRIISDKEIDRLLLALGYEYDTHPVRISARIGAALLFAIETAMRAGEIAGLTWSNVDLIKRTARLMETKNGTKRDVPLSLEAIRILEQVRTESELIFNLKYSQIDANFRQAKSRAMIKGLTFHDSRHTAITRLASKLTVLELARMVGHRDIRQLMIYYNESAEDIAKKL